MKEEHIESKELITKTDAENDKIKDKTVYLITWLISNVLSVAIPIGAIAIIGMAKVDGSFNIKENYSEMLMCTISICMNIILQLNYKDYNINESISRLIRLITIGALVTASISYGVTKTLLPDGINIEYVFGFSVGIMVLVFLIGFICECNRKRGL